MFLKKTLNDYRVGAVGATLDEYELAIFELKSVAQNAGQKNYSRLADSETENEDCRSIQTIVSHVVRSGYSYSNYIRETISVSASTAAINQIAYDSLNSEIEKMLDYTFELFDQRWSLMKEGEIEAEITDLPIQTRWGLTYNIDQLLEHAIVHVLKHRRQIQKFLLKFEIEEIKN